MNPSHQTVDICSRCGRTIPGGEARCDCAKRPRYWLHSRETILLLCFGALALAFAVTGFAARVYHGQRGDLAQAWHQRGVDDMRAGRAAAALGEFQTALVYLRVVQTDASENLEATFDKDLAEALMATGRLDSARAYLTDLWERSPGSGSVNLDLARLAVRARDDDAAKRYYSGAINGVWEGDADSIPRHRFETRLELYRYLTERGDRAEAESILLATAAALPPDAPLHVQMGKLLLGVGQPQQAFSQFQQALGIDRNDREALQGEGLAEFALGNDRAAVRHLEQAVHDDGQGNPSEPADPDAVRTLATAQMVVANDPFRAGLDPTERQRRAERNYQEARARVERCAESVGVKLPDQATPALPKNQGETGNDSQEVGDLAAVYAQGQRMMAPSKGRSSIRSATFDSDHIDQVTEIVFQMEAAATARCGEPSDPADAALSRIAQRVQSERQ